MKWERPAVDILRLKYKTCSCGKPAITEYLETYQTEPNHLSVWIAECNECHKSKKNINFSKVR